MAEVIGLVSGILTLLDFGFKIVSGARSLRESRHGRAPEVHDIDIIVRQIRSSHEAYATRGLKIDKDTAYMVKECETLSKELSEVIRKLGVREDAKFKTLEQLRVSVRTLWSTQELKSLRDRLLLLDQQIREKLKQEMTRNRKQSIMAEMKAIEREKLALGIIKEPTLDRIQNDIISIAEKKISSQNKRKQRKSGPATGNSLSGMNNESVEDEQMELATHIPRLMELMIKLSILQKDQDASLRQIKVIKSLFFKEVFRRFEKIPEVDKLSNEWLFDPDKTNFLEWLESCKKDDRLFYIFGKVSFVRHVGGLFINIAQAGSGKSTLMKFAAEEPRTRNALESWSGSKMLHTAHYYFWNQGSEMQKSGVGLFQSLLYQILRTTPELIGQEWPDRLYHEKWEMKELQMTLEGVLASTKLKTNYCFFIDGLDEYDGDEDDIIQLLSILAASEHIKLCLSSRPGRIYEKELSKPHRNFDIAKFTREDMKNHAHTELAKSERFRELAKVDPDCGNIISDISEWSNGVWLWVYLVTREIRREVDRGERVDTLRRIIDEFPSDLEKFFDRMIQKINPRYKEQMAQIFLIAIEELQPLPLYAFALLEQERTEPHFGQYAIKSEIKPLIENEIVLEYEGLKSRLQNRCGDLLVVDSGPHPICLSHSVDFLHRTVRDFLRDNYHQELRKYLKTEFDPLISLCNISLALLKGSHIKKFRKQESIEMVIGLTDELLYYAREAERRNDNAHVMGLQLILDELDRVNTVFASRNGSRGNHWTQARDSPPPRGLDQYKEGGNYNFLALAIQARLVGYVRAKLQANSPCQKKSGRPLLDYALRPYRVTPISMPYHSSGDDPSVDINMITLLLDYGADPNQPVHLYDGETVWGLFLVSIHELEGETSSSSLKPVWFRACQAMIHAGAEPDYKFIRGRGKFTVLSIIKRVFSEPQVVELKEEMEKKRLETETAKQEKQSGQCTAM